MSTNQPASGKPTDPLSKAAAEQGRRALEGYLPSGGARPGTVLCYEPDARARKRLSEAADGLKLAVHCSTDFNDFKAAFENTHFDVVILSLDRSPEAVAEIAEHIAGSEAPTCLLLSARKPTLDHGILAMRCGAVDLIAKPFDVQELRERIAAAADRAQRLRQQQRRLERLKRICRRLNQQRHETNTQVDVLCADLSNAYHELAKREDPAAAEPLAKLIATELDVEVLLRKTLEHMLTRTGPTNAAVFLPGSDGDFSLGAYVNYNLSRDTADTLLDHLADVLPDKFEHERTVAHLRTDSQLEAVLDDHAPWLSGSELMTAACHDEDGQCLAVLALFRDESEPFNTETADAIRSIRDVFSSQLAKVVRVHNRATPKAEWLGFDVGEERDEDDTSSDWGMAA